MKLKFLISKLRLLRDSLRMILLDLFQQFRLLKQFKCCQGQCFRPHRDRPQPALCAAGFALFNAVPGNGNITDFDHRLDHRDHLGYIPHIGRTERLRGALIKLLPQTLQHALINSVKARRRNYIVYKVSLGRFQKAGTSGLKGTSPSGVL